jgi:uroporphyrinogen III methyltransferase/synthase
VLLAPAIRIDEPANWSPVDEALGSMEQYDWLVFSSSNGVDYLLRRLFEIGHDVRRLGGVKLAAIGAGTAERLSDYHLNADLVPDTYTAEALAESLVPYAEGKRFLLARASRGREVLAEALRDAGGDVTQVVVYSSVGVEHPDPRIAEALEEGEIHWVTVASSETARSLDRLYGSALNNAQLASISPLTSAVLRELGHEPVVEATAHTMQGIATAITQYRAPES